jgi:hypothetical protein
MHRISRRLREDSPQLVQRVNPDLWRPERHRRAHRSVAHPCRQLSGHGGTNLDVEDLAASTLRPLAEPQSLAVQRVPPVFDDDKLRSVC